jgi:hypothetical protein
MMILEKWALVLLGDPYTPPEAWTQALHGDVYGNPKFADGDSVTTTQIVSGRVEGDNVLITTKSGSEYLLGVVNPNYEAAYPNARERVLKAVAANFKH